MKKMILPEKQSRTVNISYWQVFRLVFVLFSLYLLGDAFYRWDGFSKYALFSEFLPGVALAYILWTITAIFTTTLLWMPPRLFEWLCNRIGFKIKMEHLLLYLAVFILLGALTWKVKMLKFPDMQTVRVLKLIILICVAFISIFPAWLFRKKAAQWINVIQERITPLVWLFGAVVIFSMPLVAYHTWWKQAGSVVSQAITPSSVSDEKRPNIVLVIFDTLTARNMSLYGYHRPTTPFINEWAKKASVFTNTEAESNYTTPTTASFMTGKRVWTHRTYHISGSKPVNSNIESLPAVLKKAGYYNMAFLVNSVASVKSLDIAGSFEIAPNPSEFVNPSSIKGRLDKLLYQWFGDRIRLHDWILKSDFILNRPLNMISSDISVTAVPPENAFKMFLKAIEENNQAPYFAWIHVYPPHEPYLPPEPFKGYFNSSDVLRSDERQEEIILDSNEYLLKSQPFPEEMQPDIDLLRDYYDEFIRYCDKQFEDFILKLKENNKLENTIIIFSSDHGESFEHGYFGHGGPHLYEQVTHIPLIIKEPNQTEGRTINNLVEQIDIPATILELTGLSVPGWMEGRSLSPLLKEQKLERLPAFSMNLDHNSSLGQEDLITKGTIAVWEGDYKLIHYLEEKKSLLFNLKEDPDELNNLFNKEPQTGQYLLNLVRINLEKANERIKAGK